MSFVIALLTLILLKRNEIVHLTDFETILLAFMGEVITIGYMISAKLITDKPKPQ